MDNLKTVLYYLSRIRYKLAIAGTDESAAPMVEMYKNIEALKTHADMLRSKMTATKMEENMLALAKAVKKSLEEPVRKKVLQSAQTMGGRHAYTSNIAPLASKAIGRIWVKGADIMQPAELLHKVN